MKQANLYFSGQLGDGTFHIIKEHLEAKQRPNIMMIRIDMMTGSEPDSILTSHLSDFDKQMTDTLSTNQPVIFDITSATGLGVRTVSRILEERKLGGIELPKDKPLILILKSASGETKQITALPSMQKLDTIQEVLEIL